MRRIALTAAVSAIALAALMGAPAQSAPPTGPQTYAAKAVKLDGLLANLEVTVSPTAQDVTLDVSGPAKWLAEVKVSTSGDTLSVVQSDRPERNVMRNREDWLTVKLTVPAKTGLTVADYIGEGRIGDLMGPLDVDGIVAGKLDIGNVGALEIGVDGDAILNVGTAATAVINIGGSGDVTVGNIAKNLEVDINGSGNVTVGAVPGNVDVSINGSGDMEIAEVDGRVKVSINGSGDVAIKGGTADPLDVSIAGSGDVTMAGTARNQSINNSGSGKVRIANAAR